jgi:uncharacterized protein with HEPN domain
VKDERVYLLHALDAIDAILKYTVDGRDAFFADRKTQDAVVRNVEIIGQAVKGLSGRTRALESTVPWRQIAGMRDKLIHEYFGVDLALVWDVVERELPALRPRMEEMIRRLADEETRPAPLPWDVRPSAASSFGSVLRSVRTGLALDARR